MSSTNSKEQELQSCINAASGGIQTANAGLFQSNKDPITKHAQAAVMWYATGIWFSFAKCSKKQYMDKESFVKADFVCINLGYLDNIVLPLLSYILANKALVLAACENRDL